MIVVANMILRALSLDSCMPSRFWRKKYSVVAQAMTTAPQFWMAKTVELFQVDAEIAGRDRVEPEADNILTGGDAADRPRQDVVKKQGGNRKLGYKSAQGLFDHAINAAADEEGTALDVDGAHPVAEEQDAHDEPGGGFADGTFDDGPDVIGRTGQIAQHDGRRSPIGNEGERHAADDDHLRRPQGLGRGRKIGRGRGSRICYQRGRDRAGRIVLHERKVPF